MNVKQFLVKEKRVAGIEISDSVVRIVFFEKGDDKKNAERIVLVEEPIPGTLIAEGAVTDPKLFGKTLKTIWEKANTGTDYAIVSIPHDKVYSHIFSFPRSVEGARLTEAMRLAINFQLPLKTDDAYLDWERTPGTPILNEILLAMIPRAVAKGYIDTLEFAGIKTIAMESHLSSIARSTKIVPDQTVLFTEKTPDGAIVFALKDRVVRFTRSLPGAFVPESKIPEEVRNILTSLEATSKTPVVMSSLADARIREDYASLNGITEPHAKWLIALGAAVRGKIPDGEDNLVSLLPVGTEEAYTFQRITSIANFVRNATISASVFFVLVFGAAYLFMYSLAQNANRTTAVLSEETLSPELIAKEEWVTHVNALTSTARTIIEGAPLWSVVIQKILTHTIDGITISNVSLPGVADKISLSGTAKDRPTLNQYKAALQNSTFFTEIELPITNLEQRTNIPFTASFRAKDRSTVYYK